MDIYEQLAKFNFIETERLYLRPLSMADAEDMFSYASQPENLVYVFPKHNSIAETKFVIANMFMKSPLGKWAIENKSDNKMIGTITFVKLNETNRYAELGYVLNQRYWGQGLMTEAVQTISAFCLDTFGFNYLDIVVDCENLGSIKVAEKAQFQVIETYKALSPYTKVLKVFKKYRKAKHE